MKYISKLGIVFLIIMLSSCSILPEPVKKIGLGDRVLNYQGEESVSSLVIPPDLTKPNFESEYSDLYETENSTFKGIKAENVEVKRDNFRRWLVVDKTPSEVWPWIRAFLRSFSFKIEKEDQKIGIMETDYLEIDTDVPDKSLGTIRAMLAKALKTKYGLPIADKYRIRIEETADNKTEIYMTLSSIEEVSLGGSKVWQARTKDVELETEMLLRLMIFLGSDRSEAIEKITKNSNDNSSQILLNTTSNGYAELIFPYNKKQTWNYLGWALDEIGVDIEDRDIFEGSYYVKGITDKGYFAKLLSTVSQEKTYQLIVNQIDENNSRVIFIDLSEENEKDAIDFSFDFFNEIAAKF